MALPDPRRIVIAYDTTTGAPIIADELIPAAPEGPLRSAFVQTSFVGNPNEGLRGKDEKPDLGFIRRGGVTASFLEFAPGQGFPLHYTSSLDYVIMLVGKMEVSLHDGTTKMVGPGDLVVQLGTVHGWKAVGEEPARAFVVALPSETVKISGKTVEESGIEAMKLF